MKKDRCFSLNFSNSSPVIWKANVLFNRLILLAVCVCGITVLKAQEAEQVKLETFFVADEPLRDVIEQLSQVSHLNFTYDASNPIMDKLVTYKAVNQLPLEILSDLLLDSHYAFKEMGNQVVIFRHVSENKMPPPEIQDKLESPNLLTENVVKNEPLIFTTLSTSFDTIFLRDTILRVDTLKIFDTVFIVKKGNTPQINKLSSFPVDYFEHSTFRKSGWGIGLSASTLVSDFTLVTTSEEWSWRNAVLDLQVTRNQQRWAFLFGIQFSQFAQKYNHQYEITSGGYYQRDTIDAYYTVVSTDTSWYYVTDSSWLPLNSQSYNTDRVNRVGYLSITAESEFIFWHRPAFNMVSKLSLIMSVPVYRSGVMINDENQPEGTSFGDLTFSSPVFGFTAGVGTRHRLGDKFDLIFDAYYLHYFNTVLSGNTSFKAISGVGLKAGIRYYF